MKVEEAIAIFQTRFDICAQIITVTHGGTDLPVSQARRLLEATINEALDDAALSHHVPVSATGAASAADAGTLDAEEGGERVN